MRYEQNKKDKEARKKAHNMELREVKLRPKIEEHDYQVKFRTAERLLFERLGGRARFEEVDVRLLRFDRPDAPVNELATAHLRITVKDPDPDIVGRRFSGAATELALASYPGFYLTSPPGDGTAYGVFWPTLVWRADVEETVVHHDGRRVPIEWEPSAAPSGPPGAARANAGAVRAGAS